jgi:trk system potassium uptake protein TrkA
MSRARSYTYPEPGRRSGRRDAKAGGKRVGTTPERVTVIGLGRFGTSVAKTLFEQGYEVTAIDIDEERVTDVADFVTLAAQGDGTDEDLLRSLAVDRSHFGIVAQGENVEAGALATLVLKRLQVPWVVARATNDLHGELLRRVGANLVIFPERDAGVRLGHSLSVHAATDYIPLSAASGIAKLTAPPHFFGDRLDALSAGHESLEVLLIRRGSTVITNPAPSEIVRPGDTLVVVGLDKSIDAFAETDSE